MDATEAHGTSLKLTQGSYITVIGIPDSLVGGYLIDLTLEPLLGDKTVEPWLVSKIRITGDLKYLFLPAANPHQKS
ncbi:unnamed protein product [Arabis nemorensis]|uniref:Uncharacterized protein n=1 Tax=Arabis nemorensis TaxID=586526 RepID=A0A565CBN1_9BRAS|nr:unnamed protein product [Arabis nemorensis]